MEEFGKRELWQSISDSPRSLRCCKKSEFPIAQAEEHIL